MTINTQSVSTETLLELVAAPRRRQILHLLQKNGDRSVAIEDLTESIATDGGNTTARHAADSTHALLALQHTHLPMLAEAGLVEYDRRTETIRYRSSDRLEELLQFVSTRLE